MCEYIHKQSVPSMPLLDQLVNQRWLRFLAIDMCCYLMNGITSLENDVMDKTHLLAQHYDCYSFIATAFFMTYTRSLDYEIMQLPNTGGTPCVLQTSQRNWVIIKMLYRCLRRCLLGWHRSRLGFVTPSIGEVSLGPLGNAHHKKPCK